MGRIEKSQKKLKKVEATDIEEYLKQLPTSLGSTLHELKMEKHLKCMLEDQEKKTKKNTP